MAVMNYLHDVMDQIKRDALETKGRYESADDTNKPFFEGKLLAYYEVISLFRDQAKVFEIDLTALSMDDFDPDIRL